jgi:hypothetical protein
LEISVVGQFQLLERSGSYGIGYTYRMDPFWHHFWYAFLSALVVGVPFALLARWLRGRKKP